MMETALPNFHFHDLHPEPEDFHSDVIAGLRQTPRQLSPKFFYDERGSQLFDAITRLQGRGAQAVILGCTEIGLLIDDSVSPLPTYDTTDLHARALVAAAMVE